MAKDRSVLRANALEKVRLEHQAEIDRRNNEAERDRSDQEKALQASRQQRAVNILADGLGRLATGDISTDINEPFGAELDRLGNGCRRPLAT
ncbi:methyl-accepting chemotaxis protein (plasmid) [Sinorhizobium sojae CCBAU 05684]|uniref:Methyl-accepting chemotaxis protein n=1 Tax=Sinorhizobium sojae CCBAU 05684 TaxID=716928 RepID=A0A249PHJ4_9HYPH|nr:hypothetical protein [Sinorhizobium sojae]ASY65388.1 methyl-accepting chemotaxis protein [Sinorhizobium sojae CCBAU 05684]